MPDIVGEEYNMGGYFNEKVERKNYNRGNMERTTNILESGEVEKNQTDRKRVERVEGVGALMVCPKVLLSQVSSAL